MSKLAIGVIGCGGIARDRHLPTLKALSDDVTITAVQDINMEVAKAVADEFEIEHIVTDYQALFPLVDAIMICTPNKFHAEIAIAALDADVHVFCENLWR